MKGLTLFLQAAAPRNYCTAITGPFYSIPSVSCARSVARPSARPPYYSFYRQRERRAKCTQPTLGAKLPAGFLRLIFIKVHVVKSNPTPLETDVAHCPTFCQPPTTQETIFHLTWLALISASLWGWQIKFHWLSTQLPPLREQWAVSFWPQSSSDNEGNDCSLLQASYCILQQFETGCVWSVTLWRFSAVLFTWKLVCLNFSSEWSDERVQSWLFSFIYIHFSKRKCLSGKT